jgi:hypothetical protein
MLECPLPLNDIFVLVSNISNRWMLLCAIAFLIGCLVLLCCVKMVTDVMRVDRQLFVQNSAAAAARGVIAEFSSSANEPLRAQFLASAHDVASHIGAGIAEG